MTDNTQPEALRLAVSSSAMADEGEMIHLLSWYEIRNLLRADAAELRRQHTRIAELEAQLEATHPSPPEGMVGEWRPIETAPKDGSEVLVNATGIGLVVVYWSDDESQWGTGLGYLNGEAPTHWMPLPLPPTTAAGSEKGE